MGEGGMLGIINAGRADARSIAVMAPGKSLPEQMLFVTMHPR